MKKLILTAASLILVLGTDFLHASYKEALSLYEGKKYKESLEIIARELDGKRDLEKNSPNYDFRFLAAHNHWKLGNLQSALLHFKKCAEIKKDIPDPLIDLSLLMLDNKRYGDASFFATAAIKIAASPVPYYVLGKSSMKTGNYLKAKEYFEKALSLDPEFSLCYNDLGIVLMEVKKIGEANAAFSAALASANADASAEMPGSPEILNNIAVSLERAGKFDEALKYINIANEKDPKNPVIKTNFNRLKGKAQSAGKVQN